MKRHSEFADFLTRQRISSPCMVFDRSLLLYADSSCDAQGQRQNRLLLKNLSNGEISVLSDMPGASSPVLSPDGTQVAFTAFQAGGPQLLITDFNRNVRQITRMSRPVIDPRWSPDGKWLVFASPAADTDREEDLIAPPPQDEEKAWDPDLDPVSIEDFGYKFDGLGFARPSVLQLWIVPADGSRPPRRISKGTSHFLHANFAADSRHVICESNLYCDRSNGIAMDVLEIDIETLEIRRLTEDKMVVSYPNPVRPLIAGNGEIVIGILPMPREMTDSTTYPACTLYRLALEDLSLTPISRQTPDCFDTVQFAYNAGTGAGLEKVALSSDGTSVLFLAGYRGVGTVYKVSLAGTENAPVRLTDGEWCYNGLGNTKDGWILAARAKTDTPEQIVLVNENTGETKLLLQTCEDYMRDVALSCASDFTVPTLDGESEVHGFVLPPQEIRDGRTYPCIVYVHGGPHPFYTNSFDLEMQCFAGAGFGVIFCNPRGSSGYGDKHRNLKRAYDGSAYMDILQFVNEALRRFPWIDKNRLGLTGGSYGGYMTNYAATRCSLFKAYITQRSTVNRLISYASSDMQGVSKDYPTYGEFMDHCIEESEIAGMEQVNAPFLILHGMNDLRCPVEGAHQLFVALKDSHAPDFPVKMILYPHTGHEQPTEPRLQQHYYKAMLDWFQAWL